MAKTVRRAINRIIFVSCMHYMYFQAKHLQKVAGIHSTTYWLAKFFHNMVELLIICAILTVIFAAFQVDGYATSNELGFLFITLVRYHACNFCLSLL